MSEQVESDETIAALRAEVAQLQHAVFSHAIVDQAIGVVVAYGGVRPDTAWDVLKEISQHTNTKLREVAEHVVRWPHDGQLPKDLRDALTTAVARVNSRRGAEEPTSS
ncbi:ANTAR domain-containing protein [Streptomyces sp. NPDC046859]|uniref:ANTAR domain-containing protein n=1 Tax=Streptomyces sp. NPDC046859 TaxID=3155734 RepID=UPI0033CCAB8A